MLQPVRPLGYGPSDAVALPRPWVAGLRPFALIPKCHHANSWKQWNRHTATPSLVTGSAEDSASRGVGWLTCFNVGEEDEEHCILGQSE